jgi:hypothetical protein
MDDVDSLDPPYVTADVALGRRKRRRVLVEVVRNGRRVLVEMDPVEAARFDRELSSVRRTMKVT